MLVMRLGLLEQLAQLEQFFVVFFAIMLGLVQLVVPVMRLGLLGQLARLVEQLVVWNFFLHL